MRRKTALEEHLEKQVADLQAQLSEERRAFMQAVQEIAKSYADAVGKFSPTLTTTPGCVTTVSSTPGVYVGSDPDRMGMCNVESEQVGICNMDGNELRQMKEKEPVA